MEKSQRKSLVTICFCFYEVLKQAILNYNVRNQISGCLREGKMQNIDCKGAFW